jgi:hypothetical protein
MWGGFDLSAATKQLGALGSQLGEAIEKAKHEVVSTIDSFEKGDDYVPPPAGSSAAASAVQPPSEVSGWVQTRSCAWSLLANPLKFI